MTFPMHSFRDLLHFTLLLLLVAIAGIAGCGSDESPVSMVSPPGWVAVPSGGQHAKSAALSYISNGGSSSCAECHGADLSGGTSKVSCFGNPSGCHHGPVAGWFVSTPAAQEHGAAAKRDNGSQGFASCQICHGADFAGGGSQVPCFTCHGVSAPHSASPWRASAGSAYTHTTTAETGNAAVCASCHFPGSPNNPASHPAAPAPAGTAPGCYNGTLCHAQNPVTPPVTPPVPHPVGNAWVTTPPAGQPHGISVKAAASSTDGFSSCQACHGTGIDFAGGVSGVSCYTCHGVSAPHSARPWRASAGSVYTHTTTAETGNAAVCASCHFPGSPNNPASHPAAPAPAGTAPGCYNGTLCHGSTGAENPVPHPVGNAWVTTPPAGQPHGISVKAAASSTDGFSSCQACHGTGIDFAGGVSGVSCYTCHGVSAPHSARPWRASAGSVYTHTTTAETGNAAVCASCHFPGSPNNPASHPAAPAPAGTAPGCYNGTLCHGSTGAENPVPHPVPYNDNTHYNVAAGTFAEACGACHDLAAPSAKAGPACGACHTAGSPLTSLNCTSCHAFPPDGNAPAGAAYPNIAGAHSTHIALNAAVAPIACDTCHNGLGTNTLNHYNRADARSGKDAMRVPPGDTAFLGEYNAMSGTAAFTAANRTCSNLICHGGQATPDWQTATADAIDVPNACLNCHVSGTTQYNSYNSGKHDGHITLFGLSASACKLCHDVAKVNVSGHFQNLATPAFEQPAPETILPEVRYDGNTCNPQAGGLTGCHKARKW